MENVEGVVKVSLLPIGTLAGGPKPSDSKKGRFRSAPKIAKRAGHRFNQCWDTFFKRAWSEVGEEKKTQVCLQECPLE